jgi:hypothetical protein
MSYLSHFVREKRQTSVRTRARRDGMVDEQVEAKRLQVGSSAPLSRHAGTVTMRAEVERGYRSGAPALMV